MNKKSRLVSNSKIQLAIIYIDAEMKMTPQKGFEELFGFSVPNTLDFIGACSSSEEQADFFKAFRTCFASGDTCHSYFKAKLPNRKLKWINCVFTREMVQNGAWEVRCVFRDHTAIALQEEKHELCLSLWEDSALIDGLEPCATKVCERIAEIFNAKKKTLIRVEGNGVLGVLDDGFSRQGVERLLHQNFDCLFKREPENSITGFLKTYFPDDYFYLFGFKGIPENLMEPFQDFGTEVGRVLVKINEIQYERKKHQKIATLFGQIARVGKVAVWEYDARKKRISFDSSGLGDKRSLNSASGLSINGDRSLEELVDQFLHPGDKERAMGSFLELIAGKLDTYKKRVRLKLRKDGEYLPFLANVATVEKDASGKPVKVAGFNVDLSEIESMREKLIQNEALLLQNQKMAAIGELCVGIAHEIKNPLSILVCETSIIKYKVKDEQDWSKTIQRLENGVNKINEISNTLRKYGRAQREESSGPQDVGRIISECADFLSSYLVKDNINLCVECPEKALFANCNAGKLQQVLMNLISNSKYAILEKKSEGKINLLVKEEEGKPVVIVSDDGRGIPEKNINSIFERSFTTKPADQGTGIGLWLSRKLMREQGGDMKLLSTSANGTAFSLELSRTKEAA